MTQHQHNYVIQQSQATSNTLYKIIFGSAVLSCALVPDSSSSDGPLTLDNQHYTVCQHYSTFSQNQHIFTCTYNQYSCALEQAISRRRMERIARDIYNALQHEPLRDGINHPADSILMQAFAAQPQAAANWFSEYVAQWPTSSASAEILRLLCRFKPYTPEWRRNIVEVGLLSPSAEARDAAMQAVESWGDPELVSVLRAHSESEGWLAHYAQQIVRDLEG